ncbi:hypothetical protein ACLKA6_014239 [Drosophila palustris]
MRMHLSNSLIFEKSCRLESAQGRGVQATVLGNGDDENDADDEDDEDDNIQNEENDKCGPCPAWSVSSWRWQSC